MFEEMNMVIIGRFYTALNNLIWILVSKKLYVILV